MELYQAIIERRSIRNFKPSELPKDTILKLLTAAINAPSANNRQNWRFIVVTNKALKNKLVEEACEQQFIKDAAVVFAMICTVPGYEIDVALAAENLMLAAWGEGLGSCWIKSFNQEVAKKLLEVGNEEKIVCLIPVGEIAELPEKPARKPLEEVVTFK
ncbi:nitroreductase [Carboxydothermus islandicus]|uniref:Nitroreductase n=1 Tax=Carboxydothermus islandicus TaxID=661089 RepID=A0A1L8D3D6_9THEO|nr:nitroreductase family protein [Carboxydothermus islandicus]GAV25690.1 nitroreductase [Carboxydothermus islandicus]